MPQSIKPRRDCANILKKPEIPSKTCKKMTEKKKTTTSNNKAVVAKLHLSQS